MLSLLIICKKQSNIYSRQNEV